MQARHVMTHLLLPCLLLFAASQSHARDFLIEVVIFENVSGKNVSGGGIYVPKSERALTLGGDAAKNCLLYTSPSPRD